MQIASANDEAVSPSESTKRDPAIGLLAVIVLHKMALQDSLSYRTLLAAAERISPVQTRFHLLIIDNLSWASPPLELPSWVRYERASDNLGLAAAYNRALDIALAEGFDWIVTLDQDTDLPSNFLARMTEIAETVRSSPQIAAIVPQLIGDGRMLSPLRFCLGAFPIWYPPGFAGTPDHKVFAFNSGAVLRVSALRQMGGYDPRFWLDYSDTRLFCQLAKYGKRVRIAGDLQMRHNFSMLDKQKRMSPQRYRELLATEAALWDMEMNWLAGLERTIRLVGRYLRHLLNKDLLEYRRETLRALLTRLFHSKKWRNRDWQRQILSRFPHTPIGDRGRSNGFRPKVSVCMATYNGEKYLSQQLESILIQLDDCDEVIVVNDASTDSTAGIVSSFSDPKIISLQHAENQGVVASFEQAVRSATGDILFFSDQDDIWTPNRVSRTLEEFANNSNLDLIMTKIVLINEEGNGVVTDHSLREWPFSSNLIPNLIANRFQGSAMAFRSALLQTVLPFPKNMTFLHDAWIGARCALTHSTTGYISEPLLFYRRHAGNVSRRLSILRMVRKRLELSAALFIDSILRMFR